jgi:fumarate reductase flavoprotein subunit
LTKLKELRREAVKTLNPYFFSLAIVLLITSCDLSTNSTDSKVRYKPGMYTSSARGFIGDIKVSVSFSEDKITKITIDEHNETIERNRVALAIKNIPDSILQSQSPEVDVVSGATFTSKAIKEAVKNCVLEAMTDI